ncbi:hypothetical protein ACL7TT_11565 [Microbulbifer sp. 2304DJ12-6]|uniref:hypothetical protein n=1 Tax=Microbulbifer sp. 2304DJ12-6 TaxID=3233340 RepID=UPI0039B0AB76
MRVIVILALSLYSMCSISKELGEILTEWNLSKTPIEEIYELNEKSRAPNSYEDLRIKWDRHVIYKANGALELKINDNASRNTQLTIGDITYSSIDKGEFGGELGYTHEGSYKPLLKGNVQELITDGPKLYILEGLDHMLSRGAVYVIPNMKKPSTPQLVTLLPDSPKAGLITKPGNLVVVGSNGLYFVSANYLEIVYWNAFWSGIYLWGPTSIVKYEHKFLIGLPKGVAVVELEAPFHPPKIELYMTNEFNKSMQPTANASAD